MANLMVLAIQRSLTMPGRRICRITTSATSSRISGTSGWSLMNRLMRRPSGGGPRGGRAFAHGERLLMAMKAPSITTTTMIAPSTIVGDVRIDREQRQVGADQAQDEDRHDRSDQPAAAAAERDAAEHDRRDAGQQIRAGDRRADAGAHGQRQAAHRGEKPGQRVGDDLGARHGDAAAERGELAAADGVDRQAEARAPERNPDDAEADEEQDQRLRDPGGDRFGRHARHGDGADDQRLQPFGRPRRPAHRARAAPRPAARRAWPA